MQSPSNYDTSRSTELATAQVDTLRQLYHSQQQMLHTQQEQQRSLVRLAQSQRSTAGLEPALDAANAAQLSVAELEGRHDGLQADVSTMHGKLEGLNPLARRVADLERALQGQREMLDDLNRWLTA